MPGIVCRTRDRRACVLSCEDCNRRYPPTERTITQDVDGTSIVDHDELTGLNFRGTHFVGADMTHIVARGCDFEDAIFTAANLNGARFDDCDFTDADFRGATFAARTDMRNCAMAGARFDANSSLPMLPTDGTLCTVSHRWYLYDDLCSECGRHNDSCECRHCDNCGNTVVSGQSRNSWCSDCDCCGGCCNCDDERTRAGNPWIPQRDKLVKFPITRLVGVEWEYNRAEETERPIREFLSKWRAGKHEDGSCGYEIVTAPIAGDYIAECLSDLGNAFAKAGAQANDSCGIHVHVDARDIAWQDMYRLLRLYSRVEPILYIIGGQNRSKNHYCAPCGRDYGRALVNDDPKGAILSVAYRAGSARQGKDYVRSNQPDKKNGGRYRGLNLCPWLAGRRRNAKGKTNRGGAIVPLPKPIAKDTTVEFRLHRNTLSADRVIGWAQLCAELVDYAARATDADIANLPKGDLRALLTACPLSAKFIKHRLAVWRREVKASSRLIKVTQRGKYQLTAAAAAE